MKNVRTLQSQSKLVLVWCFLSFSTFFFQRKATVLGELTQKMEIDLSILQILALSNKH